MSGNSIGFLFFKNSPNIFLFKERNGKLFYRYNLHAISLRLGGWFIVDYNIRKTSFWKMTVVAFFSNFSCSEFEF